MTERLTSGASDEFRASAAADWQAATGHRLFREIIDDSVDDRVFERYLRIEYGFIDTAAAALGAAVARAPSIEDRAVLAAGLHDLLTNQVDFFEGALAGDKTPLVPPSARGIHLHFDAMARSGEYPELLATMLGAEWVYQTWCAQTVMGPSRRDTIRAWTELHTSPAFTGHVAWLRDRIDALVATSASAPAARARLGQAFQRTLVAEVRFHDAAYDDQ